jgi:hypothetical protein
MGTDEKDKEAAVDVGIDHRLQMECEYCRLVHVEGLDPVEATRRTFGDDAARHVLGRDVPTSQIFVSTLRAMLHVENIEDPPPALFALVRQDRGIEDGLPLIDVRLVKYVLSDDDQA